MTLHTTARTEYAIRIEDGDGVVRFITHHKPGWGTRFQDPPTPYTGSTAQYDIERTTQYPASRKPRIVTRHVVEVVTEWAEPATPKPQEHERWLDIDWTDSGGIRSYKTEHCNCPTPWRHRP